MGKHKPAKTGWPACWGQHLSQRLPGGEQIRGRQVRRRREGEVALAEGESKGDRKQGWGGDKRWDQRGDPEFCLKLYPEG